MRDSVAASGHSLDEIIIMASLIEKEARTTQVRRIISGILWNRIGIDMPLQVDAVFGYILNRPTFSPTFDDLKIDSPFNTYRNKGLPPGPIGSPSLDAILAAADPEKNNYLFYLSDPNGVMHYSVTFEEHKANRAAFLK